MKEHYCRARSIPPRTLNILRSQEGKRRRTRLVSIGRLTPKESGQGGLEQNLGGFNVKDHVFQRPTKKEPNKSLIVPEAERITREAEVHKDYDTQRRLGVILQFSEIEFTTPVFERSRHDYGPDSRVFYSPVKYKDDQAFLVLATYGDILEFQVVATKIDARPFFREEIYLPDLTITYDPTSMAVCEKNRLVVVNYDILPSLRG